MAHIEHLPIYKASYDLCLYFEKVVRGFSRYHKYSLGNDLRDAARRVLRLVVHANNRRHQLAVLISIREELDELKVLLRLCNDVKAFPNVNSFEYAIGLVTDIAKQNEAWLKRQQRNHGQNRPAMSARLADSKEPSKLLLVVLLLVTLPLFLTFQALLELLVLD